MAEYYNVWQGDGITFKALCISISAVALDEPFATPPPGVKVKTVLTAESSSGCLFKGTFYDGCQSFFNPAGKELRYVSGPCDPGGVVTVSIPGQAAFAPTHSVLLSVYNIQSHGCDCTQLNRYYQWSAVLKDQAVSYSIDYGSCGEFGIFVWHWSYMPSGFEGGPAILIELRHSQSVAGGLREKVISKWRYSGDLAPFTNGEELTLLGWGHGGNHTEYSDADCLAFASRLTIQAFPL